MSSSSSSKQKTEEKSSSSPSSTERKKKQKEEEVAKKRKKEYMKAADPRTVDELVDSDELEKKYMEQGKWGPAWCDVQFDGDACLKNVLKNKKEGFYVPAGSIVPLGAQMPEMTVIKYGGYFPQGTSFPGGVMIPLHARMVNLLPQETKNPSDVYDDFMCCVQ